MAIERRTGEINALAIAKQPSGKELVVDIQRSCTKVVGIDHCVVRRDDFRGTEE
jgi:hypothetical protein